MRNLQKLAAGALEEVLAGAALHQVLPRRLQQLETPGERGALQDIVYGSLRQLGRLDAWLTALLERPLTDPELGWLLRVAIYQLAYTRAPAHAVVHNAVTAAGEGWRRGLANAVLRNFQRRRAELEKLADEQPRARWSHPDWWIAKLQAEHPDHWQGVLEASQQHPPFTLRVNCRHGDVAGYLQRLTEAGMTARQTGPDAVTLDRAVPVHSLPGFDAGDVSVQDAGAQWAARLLDAQPGERILDACAAPGGKTGHILERADVTLTAVDADVARLARVEENLNRLQLDATLIEGDAAQPETWWDGQPYDRILADVPCSASGVVRRNPDIKWLRRPDDIPQFAAQQAVMLEALWRLLVPGGTLLYATCSLFNEENDGQVRAFLARHAGDAERCPLPEPLSDGSLLPDAEHDGFFYALLRKM
ncbi:MAG TPA: 16S rRNA (cytosine(967)-C(5))-methyltransferase RsmB [Thiobacillus sp.]|nr:16S rRNA (cytosine(967)-C(5))-methyltransferase RsmB [Gammaproteobacteria bacterium]OYZ29981.1 MAG: 16S rRNA (cytosine(967)-C(5))-methyltransferase [Hydrogenophilales bacterium 16-64-40]OZA35246.1 MAG: 16S rRNA (cytosine(967)-C(5))-methyltransferase [Hydrogenophilales bacterium 17-64-65]HQS81239.1 16S rRNA (cytosine(967)-C(5))-methyltransferase RsmB [Thiobacillus sp.]HQT32450.1 16S rRNA (cytosine(967)-C(5))-methyltransferase RsmB [Thiobacillus sp.]